MNNTNKWLIVIFAIFLCQQVMAQNNQTQNNQGTITLSFIPNVAGKPLVLNDSSYTNPFDEIYQISKFRFYVSQVSAKDKQRSQKEKNSYHLIDAADPSSLQFSFSLKPGKYNSIDFLLGVDSVRNFSGAQTGELDPVKNMFWTWNSGYVMLKLEGRSTASTALNNRIEYHIGGYSGAFNTIKKIHLDVNFEIVAGKSVSLPIKTDINTLWQGAHDIRIAASPVCAIPCALAMEIADNYSKMFSIIK